MTALGARGRAGSAADAAARIEAIRRTPDGGPTLAGMLAEQSPLFAGRGTTETERLRGYILASFEQTGLPEEAVPFVLEELETGRTPYTVAAAARALRGASIVPAEAPTLLVSAIARLHGADDVVSFERFELAAANGGTTTALAELARTLTLLGPRASSALGELQTLLAHDGASFSAAVRAELAQAVEALSGRDPAAPPCCGAEDNAEARTHVAVAPAREPRTELAGLALEDQDGERLTFEEAFTGRPTALAFFYTRCMVPEKCSLTVTRLAELAHFAAAEGLDANVAGISYDPGFDRPARLKTYGADRGMTFSPRCRLLRTAGSFDPLREAFDLGVGFGPVTVNRHRLDLLVLDGSLRVTARFERRLWDERTVFAALRAAAPAAARA